MKINNFGRTLLGGLALCAAAIAAPASAQDTASFPNKPIRVVVPFAAGGGNDIFARLVGQKAGEILGQTFVIENKPGAGGRIAAEYVMNQPRDGYTLFVGASGVMSIAAAAFPNLPYHPTKTFVPLAMIADFPLILVVAQDHPAKNVKEMVEWAKQNPDKSNYAATSPAFIIASELLKLESGMPGTMIPYKSSNEMILSVMQGQTLLAISDGPPAMPMIKGNKVKALAVTGSKRSGELPDVPSMAEAGFPGVNTALWSGFFAPVNVPAAITAKLEDALRKAIADPGVSDKLKGMAVSPGGGTTAAQFRAMIDQDIQGYEKIIKAANLKFDN
ncbi:MAG: tripartite tricarboxylate transporter substrate-binding protein [Xanthobacteraceae bacterium]|jgi:tripartite-type tricarboxylate transporter receptor subunit TctC|nr:tripartite tricarboxylate transporter substrate-binding protein [Xanthobacteraceae bacterium]